MHDITTKALRKDERATLDLACGIIECCTHEQQAESIHENPSGHGSNIKLKGIVAERMTCAKNALWAIGKEDERKYRGI